MQKDLRSSSTERWYQSPRVAVPTLMLIALLFGVAGMAAVYGSGWLFLYGVKGTFLPQTMESDLRILLGFMILLVPQQLLYHFGELLLRIAWELVKGTRKEFGATLHD